MLAEIAACRPGEADGEEVKRIAGLLVELTGTCWPCSGRAPAALRRPTISLLTRRTARHGLAAFRPALVGWRAGAPKVDRGAAAKAVGEAGCDRGRVPAR